MYIVLFFGFWILKMEKRQDNQRDGAFGGPNLSPFDSIPQNHTDFEESY